MKWKKLKIVNLEWPYEWNWLEYPKHLNEGLKHCTGDWILRLDIDQFVHEKDFEKIREELSKCPQDCEATTFQKMSFAYGKKYYQKGGQPIAFRNRQGIEIGKCIERATDLCFAVRRTGEIINYKKVDGKETDEILYELPIGHDLKTYKTGIEYWNYDYFFKTKEFTRKEFWRMSRAYHAFFNSWEFGYDEEASFQVFLDMLKGRYNRSPYEYTLETHSKYIQKAILELKPEQFGFNGWGIL